MQKAKKSDDFFVLVTKIEVMTNCFISLYINQLRNVIINVPYNNQNFYDPFSESSIYFWSECSFFGHRTAKSTLCKPCLFDVCTYITVSF